MRSPLTPTLTFLLITALSFSRSFTLRAADSTAPAAAPDPVVAKGKGFEVRRHKLDEAWAIYRARMSRGGQLPDESTVSVEIKLLNHIIETEILLRKASPEEKKNAEQATERLMLDSRKRFATEEDFRDWLKIMGMSPEQYRTRAIESRMCESVIDREIGPTVSVSNEQLKKYYEENATAFNKPEQARARQIVLFTVDQSTQQPLPEGQKREKEQLARKIKSRVDAGEDFFKLSKEFSEEAWAKEEANGDELLYVRGQLPPAVDTAMFALAPGKVSDVIESPYGYHLLRVSKKESAGRLSLSEVSPRLKDFLIDEEIKKKLPAYLEQLRKDANVEVLKTNQATSNGNG